MGLADYFENTKGLGVLATADSHGKVDVAVYARPHMGDDDTLAFIMSDRTTHGNLQSNPHAAYLFIEDGPGYKGRRLNLTKLSEDTDPQLIDALRRKGRPSPDEDSPRYLVRFRINEVRPVVGG